SYRLEGDAGRTATAAYSTHVTVPAPPVADDLTSVGDPGLTQQKPIGIVAGQSLDLLDAADHPAPDGVIVVPGEGTYTLGGSATLLFEPDASFRGTAHGIRYKLTDEYGQSATGSYQPTVTGGTSGGGGGGTGSGGATGGGGGTGS